MAATLDTLRLAKRFREAGAAEPLAEAFADALRERQEADLAQLATKADLRAEADALRAATRGDVAEVKADLALARAEVRTELAELRNELKALEQRMTIRLGGMIAGGVVLVTAAVKLL